MSLARRNAKRDTAEAGIVYALREAGHKVWPISGEGIPDLLVLAGRTWILLEVKTGNAGRLTDAQIKFFGQTDTAPRGVVRTAQEALEFVSQWGTA